MVVGAAGSGCPVSRLLNAPGRQRATTVVAREVEYAMDAEASGRCQVQGPVAEVYFTADLQGYGWCVRKHDVMNVGLGRVDGRLPITDVDAFGAFVRETRGVAAPESGRWRGHAYVAGAPPALRRTGEGLVLIGDAAGLASDRSGEGIGPAVDSAIVAAEVIREAAPDFSRARLARYDETIDRVFGRRPAWPDPGRWLPPGVATRAASALLRSRTFVRRVVLDRWFLHASAGN
jgi:menaquinone-9 beta-reductase